MAVAVSVTATRRAQLQIALTADYLTARSPVAAKRFAERLERAYQQISQFPESGPRRSRNTRRLVMSPYILTYRIGPTGVEVLDVRHGRQREHTIPDHG